MDFSALNHTRLIWSKGMTKNHTNSLNCCLPAPGLHLLSICLVMWYTALQQQLTCYQQCHKFKRKSTTWTQGWFQWNSYCWYWKKPDLLMAACVAFISLRKKKSIRPKFLSGHKNVHAWLQYKLKAQINFALLRRKQTIECSSKQPKIWWKTQLWKAD